MTFNPQFVTGVELKEGDLLGSNTATGVKNIDNDNGRVQLAIAKSGSTTGPTPNGTLASVDFQVKTGTTATDVAIRITAKLSNDKFQFIDPVGTASAVLKIAPATAARVQIAKDPTLGNILVDASGRTLYLFTRDTRNVSNCVGGCPQSWHPLVTSGNATAGEGVLASLLGTITRGDGSSQVTYNGWPLYYHVRDLKPGDTIGQKAGGIWFVLSPAGEAVK